MVIVMDGISYDLNIQIDTLTETFKIAQGSNAGTAINGADIPDIIGTYFNHEMSVEPTLDNYADYNAFYEALCQPVAYHEITVPHEQGTMTYKAKITGGSMSLRKQIGAVNWWTGFVVKFEATRPQIEV